MTDTELLDFVIASNVRLVRRVGMDGSFEWVAYQDDRIDTGKDLRAVLESLAEMVKAAKA